MAENRIRKHWGDEDIRAIVRELLPADDDLRGIVQQQLQDLPRPLQADELRELIRLELQSDAVQAYIRKALERAIYDARELWNGTLKPPEAPPRSGWWRKLFRGK